MPVLALSILLAVAAGVSIVVQQVLNSNLRTALNSAAWSGLTSYLVGSSAWRCSRWPCAALSHQRASRAASHDRP